MGYSKTYPPYMGGGLLLIVRPLLLKLTFLSTRGDGFPQFYTSYPQFLGLGGIYCLNKYPNIWGVQIGYFG